MEHTDCDIFYDAVSEPVKALSGPLLLKEVNLYVEGQEGAKKALLGLFHDIALRKTGCKIPKENILLIGPSGCGKTYLVNTFCRLQDVPFAVVDSPSVTGAGYRGEDIEQGLERLIASADGDIKKAENGILFFDEFDKLLIHSNDSASPETVQAQLLKMAEGELIDLNDHGKPSQRREKPCINTENITFLFAGAFTSQEKERSSHIGFTKEETKDEGDDYDFLIESGFSPEMAGRIHRIIRMEPLTKENYVNILRDKKDSIIKQYEQAFSYDDVILSVDREVYSLAAEEAVKRNLGVRGLTHVFQEIFDEIRYEVIMDSRIDMCHITRESFLKRKAVLHRREEEMEM